MTDYTQLTDLQLEVRDTEAREALAAAYAQAHGDQRGAHAAQPGQYPEREAVRRLRRALQPAQRRLPGASRPAGRPVYIIERF